MKKVGVEKVIVIGAPLSWASKSSVKAIEGGSTLEAPLEFHAAEGSKAAWAVVKNPKVAIGADWTIDFS
jgi:alpha 1,3-glucosidase